MNICGKIFVPALWNKYSSLLNVISIVQHKKITTSNDSKIFCIFLPKTTNFILQNFGQICYFNFLKKFISFDHVTNCSSKDPRAKQQSVQYPSHDQSFFCNSFFFSFFCNSFFFSFFAMLLWLWFLRVCQLQYMKCNSKT